MFVLWNKNALMGNKALHVPLDKPPLHIRRDSTVLSPFTTSSLPVDLDMALWGFGQLNLKLGNNGSLIPAALGIQ